jgi:large subunit ribosomal protein L25
MESLDINIEPRAEEGSRAARRYRSKGQLPAVVYHRGDKAISAVVDYNQFLQLASRSKSSQLFNLKSKEGYLNGRMALVKSVQKDYVSGKLLHVDFQALREDEEITVEVPVTIVGEAPGVKSEGGVLTVMRHSLKVSCLPKDIPATIQVSVAELGLSESIHIGEIEFPTGVRPIEGEDEPVVSVTTQRQEEEKPAEVVEAAAPAADAPATEKKPEKK